MACPFLKNKILLVHVITQASQVPIINLSGISIKKRIYFFGVTAKRSF